MKARAEHELAYDFSASTVDSASGVIRGVTVMKSGVQATGKFVLIDKLGKVTKDPEQAVGKLPIFTDAETLNTLLGAAQDAGGRVKSRSDHDGDLSARAGYTANFRMGEGRVVADIYLNKSYRDRETVLETAQKTPELIGCSIEAPCTYVLEKDKALMRVTELFACDIVDEGAVTPGGLFLSAGVDMQKEEELQKLMAEKTASPTVEECMTAIGGITKQLSELSAAVKAFSAPAADPAVMNAVKDLGEKFAAVQRTQTDFIAEQNTKLANIAKERGALGLSAEKLVIVEKLADETERQRLAAEELKGKKDYLSLVAENATTLKCSRSTAHSNVQRANPAIYEAHLRSKGMVK